MDIIALDQKWRNIINTIPLVDNMNEFLVVKYLILQQKEIETLKDYPYIYAWEFPLNPEESHIGNIDLILTTDGISRFLIVECKYIADSIEVNNASQKRREKMRKLEMQLIANKNQFQKLKPDASVQCISFTNDDINDFQGFLDFQTNEWAQIIANFGFKSKFQDYGECLEELMNMDEKFTK